MAKMHYKTSGVCCSEMHIETEDDTVKNLEFIGGCNGNLKGIAAIAAGRKVDEVINTFQGITCGRRPTSCPDQLATALKQLT